MELLLDSIRSALRAADAGVLVYLLVVNGAYVVLLCSAVLELVVHMLRIRGEKRQRVLGSAISPSISILAPAYNEETTIEESVTALLALHYPNLEVVVVDDGSTDRTIDVLKERFDLVPIHSVVWQRVKTRAVFALYRSRTHPNLVVASKANGRKADATNVGLNVASGELVCVIDADTIVESDALLRLSRPFLSDPGAIAAGGTIRITNGSEIAGGRVAAPRVPGRALAGIQVVEYVRAFLFGRLGWNRLGGNLIISGAFGLFRREALIDVGGFTHDTIGEDMELVVKLRRRACEERRPHTIAFVPDAVAWTEAPESLRVLGNQRDRWHRGLLDTLWRHRVVLGNPAYGVMGLLTFPYFVVVELVAPVVEALGWIALVLSALLGVLDPSFALLFFFAACGFGAVLSTSALLLDEVSFPRYTSLRDRLLLLLFVVLETFGYRQLTVWWRLRGLLTYGSRRADWGVMSRVGFAATSRPRRPSGASREMSVS